MRQPSFRDQMIREIHAKGLSWSESRRAYKATIDAMIRGVKRGETVEIPGGTLRRVLVHRKKKQAWIGSLLRRENGRYGRIATRGGTHWKSIFTPDPFFLDS